MSPQNPPEKAEVLSILRQEIQQFEGFKPYHSKKVKLGVDEIDEKLPFGSFPLSAIHEFISQDFAELGSTYGFVSALAGLIAEGSAIVFTQLVHHAVALPYRMRIVLQSYLGA